MTFEPVSTLDDLDSLNDDEIVAGYREWRKGDPQPGPNRGRAYWHGWMNAARDHGEQPISPEARELAHVWLQRERQRRVA